MDSSNDRLPAPDFADMSVEQQKAFTEIASGPRGALIGPFAPLLRSPELMTRVQKVGEFLRFNSCMDSVHFEMCILLVARRWNQQFEWIFHQPLALEAGLPLRIVEAIGTGIRPTTDIPPDLDVLWELFDQIDQHSVVDDATYLRALNTFGDAAVVELLATIGYYTLLAIVMNVAQTPAPDSPALPGSAGGRKA